VGGINVATLITTTGPTFVGAAGLTGTANKGILPWAIVDTSTTGLGFSFATSDSANGTAGGNGAIWRPLASTEYVTSTAAAYAPTVNNLVLSGAQTLGGTFTDNSLYLASGASLTINPMQVLTLSSGGVLLQSGNSGVSGGFLSAGGAMYIFAPTSTSATTTIGSTILNSSTWAGVDFAAGNGTVSLTSFEPYTAQTTVNQGTLQLAAGTNTIVVGIATTGQPLVVNSGGALDLDGNVQFVGNLSSTGAGAGLGIAGGTITSSASTGGILVTNTTGASVFSGSIVNGNSSAVAFSRAGSSTLTLLGANTYTGATYLLGGTTTLEDSGTFQSTSSIILAYSTLALNDQGLVDQSGRLGSAPITMRGGTLTYTGRVQTQSQDSTGAVTLDQGLNTITVTAGGTGVNSADFTLGGLAQTVGSPAVVNFTGASGLIGSNARLFITGYSQTNLASNIIGAWAVVGGTDWASYNNTYGVAALNTAGYAGYDGTALPASANNPTQNIKITTAGVVFSGGQTVNTLNLSAVGITFSNNTDILNLASGGLLHSSTAASVGAVTGTGGVANGVITAGGASPGANTSLYIYNNANTLTINSTIANNGSSAIQLISTGAGTNSLVSGTTALQVSSNLTSGSTSVTVPAGATATFNNETVSGGGLPNGTTIVSGGGTTTLVLSNTAPSTGNSLLTFGSTGASSGIAATWTSGTNPTFTLTSGTTAGLYLGEPVFGAGIPSGAVVGSVASSSTFVLTGVTTASGSATGIQAGSNGNSYTGGTVINGGALSLNAPFGSVVIPAGGITINGGTLTEAANGGQIAATNVVTLNGGSTLTLVGVNTLAGLVFNNNGGAAPNISTTGGVLTLTGGITASSNNVAGPSVITAGTIDIGSGGFTITANPITADGTPGGTVISPYTATLTVTAVLQSASGTGSLVVNTLGSPGGILQLNAANTFTGGVTLNAGGLYITAAQGLGLTTSGAGGVLTIAGNNTSITGTAVTAVNPVVINSGVTALTIGNYGGAALVFSGVENWNTSGGLTITTNAVAGTTFSAQTLSGVIVSGSSFTALTKTGPGVLALTALNQGSLNLTGAAAITINNGTLQINSDDALGMVPGLATSNNIVLSGGVLSASATTTLNPNRGITLSSTSTLDTTSGTFIVPSVISGSGGLIKTGAGTLDLVAGNTYTGQTVIGGSTQLQVENTYALGGSGGSYGAVTVLNGSALDLDISNSVAIGSAIIIGAQPLTLNGLGVGGNGALRNIGGPDTFGGAITLGSNSQIQSDTGLLVLTNTITGLSGINPFLQLTGVGNIQISGAIGASVVNLNKYGAGFDILGGNNAYTGQTSIYSGILRLQNSGALGNSTAIVYAGASLELDGAGSLAGSNTSLNVGNAVTIEGYGLVTLSGFGANPGTSGGALRSTGGMNTYSGAITLGTSAQINSEVPTGSFTLSGGVAGGGFGLQISGSGNTTISGATGITGAGTTLTKTDDGVLTLSAPSTYTGATTISGGMISLQNASGFGGASGITVASGAALQINSAGGISIASIPLTLSGNGAATTSQNGALTSTTTGTNTFAGAITLGSNATISSDSGALTLSNASAIGGSSTILNTTAASTLSLTLTVPSTTALVAGQTVTGSGIAPGTTIVSIISPTQVLLSTAASVGTSTPITFSSFLTLTGAGQGAISGGVATAAGGVVMSGSGSWTLNGASTYTGPTTVNAGTLTLAGASNQTASLALNGGSLVLNTTAVSASPSVTFAGGNLTAATDTVGAMNLTAGSSSSLTVNGSSTLSLGSAFTRGADSILNVNLSASGSGLATTGTVLTTGASGTHDIFGYMLVTQGGITGLGQWVSGSPNSIQAFNSQSLATTLATTTPASSATTDFTTYGSVYNGSGVLDLSNGNTVGARSMDSLTVDTTNAFGSILLGGDPGSSLPAVLTLASGALVFQGVNNSETIYGGQIGAINSELDIHQLATGTGTLTIGSVISGGTGSVVKDGSGTLVITGPSSQIGVLTTTSGTTTVSGLSTGNLYVGEQVAGVGVPSGDTIASISGTSITLASAFTPSSANTTLTFGTQNSYSGATVIDAGLVQAASTDALSPNSPIALANVSGAALDLNGFDQMVGTISGGGSAGGNILLTNGATLDIGAGMGTVGGSINEVANLGNATSWNTYAGQVSGSGSLTLTGGSTLYLTNNSNSYTGFTDILSGTLVVSNMGQLGSSTTTITVGGPTGLDQPQGMLVLQGGASGLIINRNIDVSGFGTGQTAIGQSYAFNSIGNNTFTGIITSAAQDTRVEVTGGTTVFSSSSTLNLGASASNGLLFTGSGNLVINGLVSGGGVGLESFYRWNAGTIVGEVTLANPNNNFISDVNVVSNLVVTSPGALGAATDASSVRVNAGILELRVDPVYNNFGIKTLNPTGNGTMYAARSVGGAGINQTLVFGGGTTVNGAVIQGFNDNTNSGLSFVFNGIDGYGISAGPGAGGTITVITGNTTQFNSSLDGLLTINGNLSSADTTSRIDTIAATGDVLLAGNILDASAGLIGDHIWTKSGAGTLAIQGTASTELGVFNITNGAVAINAMGALNSNTAGGGVLIGSTTNSGFLNYLGASGTGAGETSPKAIILGGTTGNGVIFANQQQNSASTAPSALTLSSSIAATGAGARTLYLEGYNGSTNTAIVNQITGVIQDNTAVNTTSLLKSGNGTWLYAPAASSYANATLGAPNAELTSVSAASGATVLTFNSTAGLTVGQFVTGTNIAANTYISLLTPTTVTLSVATSGAVAGGTEIGFAGETLPSATVTTSALTSSGSAVLNFTNTTGLAVGQLATGTGIAANSYVVSIVPNTSVTLSQNTTGVAGAASVVFADETAASTTASTGASTASGATLPFTNTTGLAVGQLVTGTNIPANSYITAIVPNTSVTLSQSVSGAVASGASLSFAGAYRRRFPDPGRWVRWDWHADA
jgi:autotransporter-associated beta strand protein